MALATSVVVFFFCCATADILTNFNSNVSCFSLFWLYLGNSQVSVYRTIGPTLVFIFAPSLQTRTASMRRFYRVHTIHVFAKIKKTTTQIRFHLQIIIFTAIQFAVGCIGVLSQCIHRMHVETFY